MTPEEIARLRGLTSRTPGDPWRASQGFGCWDVQAEIMCINGLSAWFTMATVHDPDESEIGYSDGAIGSAEDRANFIAAARTALPAALDEIERLHRVRQAANALLAVVYELHDCPKAWAENFDALEAALHRAKELKP